MCDSTYMKFGNTQKLSRDTNQKVGSSSRWGGVGINGNVSKGLFWGDG